LRGHDGVVAGSGDIEAEPAATVGIGIDNETVRGVLGTLRNADVNTSNRITGSRPKHPATDQKTSQSPYHNDPPRMSQNFLFEQPGGVILRLPGTRSKVKAI
jgi:hypothetical protein